MKLEKLWAPTDYSNIDAKLEELRASFVFKGNPITFFQKIKTLKQWLIAAKHPPNEIELCKGSIDAIYRFAKSKKASNTDKLWSTWLAQFEKDTVTITLNLMSDEMLKVYDTYLRMKRQEMKDDCVDLATFNAREERGLSMERRQDRDERDDR